MDIFDFTRCVASELGNGWTAHRDRYDREAQLRGPAGESLSLTDGDHSHRSGEHGRVIIAGCYGDLGTHLHDREKANPITVRATRHPALIAADIESRLLPTYRAALELARPRASVDAARTQRREALLEVLPQILAPADRIHNNVIYLLGDRPISGKFTVNTGGGAHVELDVDSGHVLTLARALSAALAHPTAAPTIDA
ncbi:hypothetical protein [Nocardia sp. NPDC050710]|uniref:hypothetical protein n=1 Tax=Nocardia sp. NPDC050710 TaxID=3157220 RepID=UPI0033C9875A